MSCAKGVALVLAAKCPSGLRALTRYLTAADVDVFVHVDQKVDDAPFRAAAPANGTTFIQDRVPVFWRGFSMVEATMKLIFAALPNPKYTWFMLVSDDTMPLAQPGRLRRAIESDVEYLNTSVTEHSGFVKRYQGFYMLDSKATQIRWLPVEDREVSSEACLRFARLDALRQRGKKPLSCLYHGSQWWSLTRESVETITESWANDDWLRQSFEFSEVPDEHYFHTILSTKRPGRESRIFVHTEWDVPNPPRVFADLAEIQKRRALPHLFLRKVNLPVSISDQYVENLVS